MPLDATDHPPASTPTKDTPVHLQPCQQCGSALRPTQINLQQRMYLCSNQTCPYPLDTPHVHRFLISHPISALAPPPQPQPPPRRQATHKPEWGEQKTNDAAQRPALEAAFSGAFAPSQPRTSTSSAGPRSGARPQPPVRSAEAALAALVKKRPRPTPSTISSPTAEARPHPSLAAKTPSPSPNTPPGLSSPFAALGVAEVDSPPPPPPAAIPAAHGLFSPVVHAMPSPAFDLFAFTSPTHHAQVPSSAFDAHDFAAAHADDLLPLPSEDDLLQQELAECQHQQSMQQLDNDVLWE